MLTMRHSPFLYFTYSNGRNGVSPRAWKEKGPVFPVFCEKLYIFCPYEGWGRVGMANRETVFSYVFVLVFHG